MPHAEWVASTLGGDADAAPPAGVCAFTQRPGDVVYVPEGWYHAVEVKYLL